MEPLISYGLTTLGSAFLGSYLASYLKKKGENRAIHEDISKLVEQVRAVTTTTKEIEAKISSDLWDRQKRWEVKREVLFEATKRLVKVERALMTLETTFAAVRESPSSELVLLEAKNQAGGKWNDAVAELEETGLLVSIVCGKEIKATCDEYRLIAGQTATGIFNDDPEICDKSMQALATKFNAVWKAIRKELEIDKTT